MGGVKVLLRNPRREVDVSGPVGVLPLLRQLGYPREAVLVIVDGTLVTGDATIADTSEVEIRPVISGGAVGPWLAGGPGHREPHHGQPHHGQPYHGQPYHGQPYHGQPQ
jgi:sulfur carrier protein